MTNQTHGMLLDFRKAKNTRLAARIFFTLFSNLTTSRALDQSIQTWKTIRYFFNPNTSWNVAGLLKS